MTVFVEEQDRHDEGHAGQVPLDDMRAALREGVKPSPPKPASRPECIRMSVTSAAQISTWRTAKNPRSIGEMVAQAQAAAAATTAGTSSSAIRSFVR